MPWLLLGVVIVDRLIKYLVYTYSLTKPLLLNIFFLDLEINKGNLLGLPENVFIFLNLFSVVILCGIVFQLHKNNKGRQNYPLLFIIFGGLSNLFDRVYYKSVIDVFVFSGLPTSLMFNIADLMIIVGIMMILFRRNFTRDGLIIIKAGS